MMKITIPNSWDGITIDKFPIIYDLLKDTNIDKIDKEIRIISVLSDIPVSEIEKIQIDYLKKLIKAVNFIFTMQFPKPKEIFKHDGYWWHVNYDITKLSAGDFITLSNYTINEDTIVQNLPELASIFIKPYKRKWFKLKPIDIDSLPHIKTMKVGIVYPLCVFFCKLIENLQPDIKIFLEKESAKVMETAMEMMNEQMKKST